MALSTCGRSHAETFRVEMVDWAIAEAAIRTIREAVFISEQSVPQELEWDGLDPLCTHVLAWSASDLPIATARLQTDGRIGRMAVLKAYRGRGLGRVLLQAVLELAVKRGLSHVTLAAQLHALGFYEQAGFHAIGEPFLDAGIPHRLMVRSLLLPRSSGGGDPVT